MVVISTSQDRLQARALQPKSKYCEFKNTAMQELAPIRLQLFPRWSRNTYPRWKESGASKRPVRSVPRGDYLSTPRIENKLCQKCIYLKEEYGIRTSKINSTKQIYTICTSITRELKMVYVLLIWKVKFHVSANFPPCLSLDSWYCQTLGWVILVWFDLTIRLLWTHWTGAASDTEPKLDSGFRRVWVEGVFFGLHHIKVPI